MTHDPMRQADISNDGSLLICGHRRDAAVRRHPRALEVLIFPGCDAWDRRGTLLMGPSTQEHHEQW
jgi:hypothetical protein